MAKRIVIEYKPSIDLRQPEQAELKIEGFPDMLDALAALQNAQNQLINQMAQQRDAAVMHAQMEQARQNGLVLSRH